VSPSIALLVYTQVLPPSARAYLCMYRNKQRTSTRTWLSSPMGDIDCARLRMRCVGVLYLPMPDRSIGWASYKREKPVNSSDRATCDRVARACTSSSLFPPLLVCPHACASQLFTCNSYVFIAYPSQGEYLRGKKPTWLASPITDVTAVLVYEWNV